MTKNTQTQGELFTVAGAVLWGLFPIVTRLSYATLSPILSLGISTIFAAVFFGSKQFTGFQS